MNIPNQVQHLRPFELLDQEIQFQSTKTCWNQNILLHKKKALKKLWMRKWNKNKPYS